MYKFLKRKFIKNYKQTDDRKVRLGYGITAGVFGIVSNVVLCVAKILAGLLSGSISLLADAVNNLSDAGSSVVTVLGFKLSGKGADEKHPFGHARYEYITGLVVSFMVLAIGAVLGYESAMKIKTPEAIESSVWTYAVAVAAIAVKLWQMGLYKNFSKSIDSKTLEASAQDSLNDVFSTAGVLLGLVLSALWPSVPFDAVIGLIVSVLIVVSGVRLIKDTVDPLLGTLPSDELVKKITDKVMSYDGILGTHDMVVHNYGPANVYVTLHAEVDARVDIMATHDLIDNIERDFMRDDGYFVVIHMDPVNPDDQEAAKLKLLVEECLKTKISDKITVHDFRLVRGVTHTNVLFDVVLPYDVKLGSSDLSEILEREVPADEGHLYYYVIGVDQSYVK